MNRQLYIFSFFSKTVANLLFFGEIWKDSHFFLIFGE